MRYKTTGHYLFSRTVAVPHHLNADPDLALHFNADPDPALHFNADPDQAFHCNADPDPASKNDSDPCGSGFAHLLLKIKYQCEN
jgi:hypothetical protein